MVHTSKDVTGWSEPWDRQKYKFRTLVFRPS